MTQYTVVSAGVVYRVQNDELGCFNSIQNRLILSQYEMCMYVQYEGTTDQNCPMFGLHANGSEKIDILNTTLILNLKEIDSISNVTGKPSFNISQVVLQNDSAQTGYYSRVNETMGKFCFTTTDTNVLITKYFLESAELRINVSEISDPTTEHVFVATALVYEKTDLDLYIEDMEGIFSENEAMISGKFTSLINQNTIFNETFALPNMTSVDKFILNNGNYSELIYQINETGKEYGIKDFNFECFDEWCKNATKMML